MGWNGGIRKETWYNWVNQSTPRRLDQQNNWSLETWEIEGVKVVWKIQNCTYYRKRTEFQRPNYAKNALIRFFLRVQEKSTNNSKEKRTR